VTLCYRIWTMHDSSKSGTWVVGDGPLTVHNKNVGAACLWARADGPCELAHSSWQDHKQERNFYMSPKSQTGRRQVQTCKHALAPLAARSCARCRAWQQRCSLHGPCRNANAHAAFGSTSPLTSSRQLSADLIFRPRTMTHRLQVITAQSIQSVAQSSTSTKPSWSVCES